VAEAKSAREAFLWSIVVSPAGRQDRWHRCGPIVHPNAAGNLFGARSISEMTLTAASSHRISRPRAILFDWDNTLVDSWSTIHEALNFLMAAMDKPLWTIEETAAAPVRLALEQSGIDPGETVWFVGDTGIDMECAHNSGCVPVLLGSGMTQEEFGGCPPRFVFSDCLTLFRFVQGL